MTTPEVLIWKDPPNVGRGNPIKDWTPIAAELRAHPGQWAIIHTGPYAQCTNLGQTIRKADAAAWRPAGSFQATVQTEDGACQLYARYIGEPA